MMIEPQITRYQRWLREHRGLQFDSYDALWRWSVNDLEGFWRTIWDFFDIQSPTPVGRVLADARMPGARWFEGTQVNYARQALRHAPIWKSRVGPLKLSRGTTRPATETADLCATSTKTPSHKPSSRATRRHQTPACATS